MKTRNKILIGGAVVVIAYFLWNRNKKKKNLTASNVASGNTSTAPKNESSNLDLPTGMDLPNLTPSTNVPTEVAIKESISVMPTPAIVEVKSMDTEDALKKSLIIPIPKVTTPIVQAPIEAPVQAPIESPLNRWFLDNQPIVNAIPSLPMTSPDIAPINDLVIPTEKPIYSEETGASRVSVFKHLYLDDGNTLKSNQLEIQAF